MNAGSKPRDSLRPRESTHTVRDVPSTLFRFRQRAILLPFPDECETLSAYPLPWYLLPLAPLVTAQDDALKDPDLQQMLKPAQELQKESGPARTPVNMSDLEKEAAEIQAEQKQEAEMAKAALQKRLAAPGPGLASCLDASDSHFTKPVRPPKKWARRKSGSS